MEMVEEQQYSITPQTQAEIEKLTSSELVEGNINDVINAIECVKVNESIIYIKFKKDLYLHTTNQINVCDNLKIDIAKQIHLNPIVKLYKKIQGLLK